MYDDVLWHDVRALLGHERERESPFHFRQEIDVTVSRLSSTGHALALSSDWVIVAPFALPGERIRVRVYRSARLHSFADLLAILEPNTELRDDNRVQCKYFGKCSGCQYQMLAYDTQLQFKRDVLVNAYNNFSSLDVVPTVLPTIGSPKQYHYRTKITPHFEAPPKKVRANPHPPTDPKPDWLKIGFNEIGTKKVIDIEVSPHVFRFSSPLTHCQECPIATPVLNDAFGPIREKIIQ